VPLHLEGEGQGDNIGGKIEKKIGQVEKVFKNSVDVWIAMPLGPVFFAFPAVQ
jgi:hypothetical protein